MGVFGSLCLKRLIFPDPKTDCLQGGLLAVSRDLTSESLFEAYSFGIFPWPNDEKQILWFCPDYRGVLFFEDYHCPRSLEKLNKKNLYRFSINKEFDKVIDHCAQVDRKDDGTWITKKMLEAYKKFHKDGYAHSVEVWNDKDQLVGGLYGVYVGGIFSAESMFHLEDNTSKLALNYLIGFLKDKGLEWLDIQMVTPLTGKFGGLEIERDSFFKLLDKAHLENPSLELGI